jgi:hypothetical protein
MPIVAGNDILYLKKLAPDDNLQVWLGGYNSDGNWSKARCKEFYDHKKSLSSKSKQEKNEKNKKKQYSNVILDNIFKNGGGSENITMNKYCPTEVPSKT